MRSLVRKLERHMVISSVLARFTVYLRTLNNDSFVSEGDRKEFDIDCVIQSLGE